MRQISPQHREATAQQGILPTALLVLGCLATRLPCLSGNFGALAGPCTDTGAPPLLLACVGSLWISTVYESDSHCGSQAWGLAPSWRMQNLSTRQLLAIIPLAKRNSDVQVQAWGEIT